MFLSHFNSFTFSNTLSLLMAKLENFVSILPGAGGKQVFGIWHPLPSNSPGQWVWPGGHIIGQGLSQSGSWAPIPIFYNILVNLARILHNVRCKTKSLNAGENFINE